MTTKPFLFSATLKVVQVTANSISIKFWNVPGTTFNTTYTYTVKQCPASKHTASLANINMVGDTMTYALVNLNEDSTYVISVSSNFSITSTVTANTSTSGT